jgi:SAM-dependent methyltransferase
VLPLTGERTVPGIWHENYWFRRHEAAYQYAATTVAGRTVLEIGCGEGYGTSLLAHAARTVLALDYDAATVAHASAEYPGARFVRANLAALPLPSGALETVVSFQVIEHVWDHPQFIGECLRVLRPGGTLLVTTPNRLTFSPGLNVPVNPFHTKEFTAQELVELVRGCGFTVEAMAGLHPSARLRVLNADHGGSLVCAQLAGSPEAWSPRLRCDVASVGTTDFTVLGAGDADVDASLDLVLLARRPH